MKKILLCFLLAILCISFAFTADISVGISGNYERYDQAFTYTVTSGENEIETGLREKMSRLSAEVFIDTTYLQAAIGYSSLIYGISGQKSSLGSDATKMEGTSTHLTFSAYVKYPIGKNKMTFFPMIGGKYLMFLTYKDGDGENAQDSLTMDEIDDLNEIWLKAGIGTDINISENIFVRVTCLGGYKLNSKYESDRLELYEKAPDCDSPSNLTLDFEATVGLGFKL